MSLAAQLEKVIRGRVWADEAMKFHTVFRIGGPADAYVLPADAADIASIVKLARTIEVPLHFIGQGSNLLVSDAGVDGIVVRVGKSMGHVEVSGTKVTAQAGASLPTVSWRAAKRGLAGLEFAVGIPGSVGGAVVMNAGAHGGCIGPVLCSVDVIELETGDQRQLQPDEMGLHYRSTRILRERDHVVVGATFGLELGDADEIQSHMRQNLAHRNKTQPIGHPGAGSIFKNPDGDFSGRLVEGAGLKGTRVGGAEVSSVHANFIVNPGGATASDVIKLVRRVQSTVYDQTGVTLQPEIQLLGRGFTANSVLDILPSLGNPLE